MANWCLTVTFRELIELTRHTHTFSQAFMVPVTKAQNKDLDLVTRRHAVTAHCFPENDGFKDKEQIQLYIGIKDQQ